MRGKTTTIEDVLKKIANAIPDVTVDWNGVRIGSLWKQVKGCRLLLTVRRRAPNTHQVRIYVYSAASTLDKKHRLDDKLAQQFKGLNCPSGWTSLVGIGLPSVKLESNSFETYYEKVYSELTDENIDHIVNRFNTIWERIIEVDVLKGENDEEVQSDITYAPDRAATEVIENPIVKRCEKLEVNNVQEGTDQKYWKDYYDFWDVFVRQWFDSKADPKDEITGWYKDCVANLNLDELPEPYIGTPHKRAKAVFINLNPGGLFGDLEATKFYSNRMDKDRGWLIRKFMKVQCSYRKFIDEWSALIPGLKRHKPEVCGVDWWQGVDRKIVGGRTKRGRQIRMDWVCQIYGKTKSSDEMKSSEEEISSLDVFAPELCPYHSEKFSGLAENTCKNKILDFIKDRVIFPAAKAVAETGLDFAIAAGGMKNGKGTFTDILDAICGAPEKVWSFEEPHCGWPLNGKGKPTRRKYVLYTVMYCKPARILVTMMEGGNKAPGKNFKKIEAQIRTYCQDNPL